MSNRWARLSEDNVIEEVIVDDGSIATHLDGTWIELSDTQPNNVGWALLDDGSMRPPNPYPASWTWDDGREEWVPPIPMPENYDENGKIIPLLWDEGVGDWVVVPSE